jgi:phosphatidylglycerophosphatase A
LTRLAVLLATSFGAGFFPWGPGTAGSLVALGIASLLQVYFGQGRMTLLLLTLILFLPAVWAAGRTAAWLGKEDPGIVVIDEVLGQWLTLAGATALNSKSLVAGFILFRLFDVWKPWPVRRFEDLPAGWGIVADDLAAGIYGALILYIGGSARLY